MRLFEPSARPLVRTWRIATAARVFVLALATGQLLGVHSGEPPVGILLALAVVAAACCVAELPLGTSSALFVPVAEGVVAAVLLALASPAPDPLLVYLVLPAVVAGVRYGARAALVAWAATSVAVTATGVVAASLGAPGLHPAGVLPWLVVGLGVGLLAAQQTRAARELATARAPYVAVHRLVGELHSLVSAEALDLDLGSLCRAAQDEARTATGAARSGVWVGVGEPELVAGHGSPRPADLRLAVACIEAAGVVTDDDAAAVPLRMGAHVFGALLLAGTDLDRRALASAQERVDEYAVRLDTALLVDGVRSSATADERRRLARDIHDGVAQRIVALGYLADDLAAEVEGSAAGRLVEDVRREVEKVVDELRFSVYDLQDDLDGADGVSGALSSYVQELSRRSGLRVHLSLDERGERLPRRVETELVRIAREAIGNVHRHARAVNLWVSLTTDGEEIRLVVEDDGVGRTVPRQGHYGLHTMRERAERVGADLAIEARQDGGTTVTLRSLPTRTVLTVEEGNHRDQRLARR